MFLLCIYTQVSYNFHQNYRLLFVRRLNSKIRSISSDSSKAKLNYKQNVWKRNGYKENNRRKGSSAESLLGCRITPSEYRTVHTHS